MTLGRKPVVPQKHMTPAEHMRICEPDDIRVVGVVGYSYIYIFFFLKVLVIKKKLQL